MEEELHSYYLRPLEEEEVNKFIQWLNNHILDVWFRFKRNHIIFDDEFSQINVRVIKNHVNLVEEALCRAGYSYKLDWASLGDRRFAIIDRNRSSAKYEELMREHFNE